MATLLGTQQGGLQRTARRWDGTHENTRHGIDAAAYRHAKAPSDVDQSNRSAASTAMHWPPRPSPDVKFRWAGPGASFPQPQPGSSTAEQFQSTLDAKVEKDADASCVVSTRRQGKQLVNVVWHKMSDLRLHDHEPVCRAHLEQPRLRVVHLHVFDPFWFGRTRLGGFPKTGALRAAFWLECVLDLRASLQMRGQELFVRFGMTPGQALQELAKEVDIAKVYAYSEVCSEELEREADFEASLRKITGGANGITRSWGYTLHHIDDLEACPRPPKQWITPYLSFGAFKQEIKACSVRQVGHEWQKLVSSDGWSLVARPELDQQSWGVLPTLGDLGFTDEDILEAEVSKSKSRVPWCGGESIALAVVEDYIWKQRALKQYVGTTDWSAAGKCCAPRAQTSKLSAFLAFGCLSPRLLYWEIVRYEKEDRCKGVRGIINSLLWRDFYRFIVYYAWGNRMYHLYGPQSCGSAPGGHKIPTKWCCKHYNNIFGGSDPRLWTWGRDKATLQKWTDGTTGYPFVDASMLELRSTGYMLHLNRETVGWFFVRDLQLDWRLAAEWFESRLVDYDCVLNWGNWVYFILTQLPAREDDRPGGGPRYTLPRYSPFLSASQVIVWAAEQDPSSVYVKTWLPQLEDLPPQLAREPWRLKLTNAFDVTSLAFDDGFDAAWACPTCTLENALSRMTCGACGSQRVDNGLLEGIVPPTDRRNVGIYSKSPMIPPPPSEGAVQDVCSNCGEFEIGSSVEGCFFCDTCWESWIKAQSSSACHGAQKLAILTTSNAPVSISSESVARGWKLVPKLALPHSGPALLVDSSTNEQSLSPVAREKKKSGRWAVRGEKVSLTNQAVADRR